MNSVPKASEKLHHFYGGLSETLQNFRRTISPRVREVHNTSGGFVRLRDVGGVGDNNSQLFTRLSNRPAITGERVLVGTLEDGENVILGRLHVSGENDGLRIEEDGTALITTDPIWGVNFSTGLTATALDPDEATIVFDVAYGDARYIQRATPPFTPNGAKIQGGRFLSLLNAFPLPTLSGITLTANRLYYVPIWVPESTTCSAITFNVSTALSGSVRVGLYDCSSSFLPASRLAQSSSVTQSTTGVKSMALTATQNVTGGRWYFAALVSTTAMALSGSSVAGGIPALRGGAAGTMGQDYIIMSQEDLGGGWSQLPTSATPASASANSYIHLAGVQ